MKRALIASLVLAALAVLFPQSPTEAATLKILALGDSLTAGYGVLSQDAFPVRLEAALAARGEDVEIVDAGVSGDTAADALDRLDWILGDGTVHYDGAIVELGANDMLRGHDPALTADTIAEILDRLAEEKTAVLLAGMRAAPNLGPTYVKAFDALYPRLAEDHGALLYPFFLDGVAGHPDLNQPDGMHPTAAGVDVIVDRILPYVEKLIDRIKNGN